MCLTEAHAGTDLGLLRTRAVPAGDGSYRITGTKIFITAGEHDMTEQIVHLVLARLARRARRHRGISLFIVPKLLVGADGELGERNGVALRLDRAQDGHPRLGHLRAALRRARVGELVGEPHGGMAQMFTMMNRARLGVGVAGPRRSARRAYQSALALRPRAAPGPAPGGAAAASADPIIVHPDVRRTLLRMRA